MPECSQVSVTQESDASLCTKSHWRNDKAFGFLIDLMLSNKILNPVAWLEWEGLSVDLSISSVKMLWLKQFVGMAVSQSNLISSLSLYNRRFRIFSFSFGTPCCTRS